MQKYKLLIFVSIFILSISSLFGQKIHKKNVPSIIVNSFNQQFPRAYDVEWKMEKDVYKVEFETGLFRTDHTVWYDNSSNMIKHKAEISKRDLPDSVLNMLNDDYEGYKVSDVKMISQDGVSTYTMELKRFDEEWKVNISSDGRLLSKIPD